MTILTAQPGAQSLTTSPPAHRTANRIDKATITPAQLSTNIQSRRFRGETKCDCNSKNASIFFIDLAPPVGLTARRPNQSLPWQRQKLAGTPILPSITASSIGRSNGAVAMSRQSVPARRDNKHLSQIMGHFRLWLISF